MSRGKSAIQFNFRMPFRMEREGFLFVASCPPLDVASQGETEQDAVVNLTEAVRLFLETCFEMGTLDEVLKACGFVPSQCDEGIIDDEEEDVIDVPLILLAARKHAQNHAC